MKKLFVVTLIFCIFVSCNCKRAGTIVFHFEPEQISSVKDSLVKFKELAVDYFNTYKKADKDVRSIYLTSRKEILFDEVILGKWSDFDTNKDSIFHSNTQLELFDIDKKGLFSLLKFLNENFIDGIYYLPNIGYSGYSYYGEPFFGTRIQKRIILKSEFYALPEERRNFILTHALITDDKEGMLLFADKIDLLPDVYGPNYLKKAPEKWIRITDEVFHK